MVLTTRLKGRLRVKALSEGVEAGSDYEGSLAGQWFGLGALQHSTDYLTQYVQLGDRSLPKRSFATRGMPHLSTSSNTWNILGQVLRARTYEHLFHKAI